MIHVRQHTDVPDASSLLLESHHLPHAGKDHGCLVLRQRAALSRAPRDDRRCARYVTAPAAAPKRAAQARRRGLGHRSHGAATLPSISFRTPGPHSSPPAPSAGRRPRRGDALTTTTLRTRKPEPAPPPPGRDVGRRPAEADRGDAAAVAARRSAASVGAEHGAAAVPVRDLHLRVRASLRGGKRDVPPRPRLASFLLSDLLSK